MFQHVSKGYSDTSRTCKWETTSRLLISILPSFRKRVFPDISKQPWQEDQGMQASGYVSNVYKASWHHKSFSVNMELRSLLHLQLLWSFGALKTYTYYSRRQTVSKPKENQHLWNNQSKESIWQSVLPQLPNFEWGCIFYFAWDRVCCTTGVFDVQICCIHTELWPSSHSLSLSLSLFTFKRIPNFLGGIKFET